MQPKKIFLFVGLALVSIFTFAFFFENSFLKNSLKNNSPKKDTKGIHNSSSLLKTAFLKTTIDGGSSARPVELGNTTTVKTEEGKESSVVFNDPAIQQKWDIKKTDADRAWQVSQGSREIRVAVIDTGVDAYHEDLSANLWINLSDNGLDANGNDKATNGIDDDHNGYIDDVHGWNFVSNNADLTDNHGHGTHIAGIIGAVGGNGKGIIGIAPQVSLMILKYYDPKTASDNLKNTVQAIHYAIKMNANIINYSGGGTEYSNEERTAIEAAKEKGILFVAAAGNEKSNSDKFKYYPADYGLSNIISVTAIDPNLEVLSSSNYGVTTVDIAAPGQNILSCLPGNNYGYMTGTSQATAFVSGAAAVVMAHKQSFQAEDVKKYLLATGDINMTLINKTGTSSKLNLYKALTVLDQGIGLTGVKAANDMNLKPFALDSNQGHHLESPEGATSKFGKSLLNSLKTSKIGNKD
jgi:subtilisin family serine protease